MIDLCASLPEAANSTETQESASEGWLCDHVCQIHQTDLSCNLPASKADHVVSQSRREPGGLLLYQVLIPKEP